MAEKDIKWTVGQRRAIEARGANLLVAASAGTGKTAVLVERCIQLATDPSQPIDIDRLLVVTFTEAAAAEMRNRISAALRERIEADPANARLRRQLILLDRASISTLHAYALRTLQEQFFRLGLDPNLNVMDPEEATLLRFETLEEVLEALYTDEGELGRRFGKLVERYGRNGSDDPVRGAVLELSDFMRTLPWPEHWRDGVLASYPTAGESQRFEKLRRWHEPFVAALREDLERVESDARKAAHTPLSAWPMPPPYADHFEAIGEAMGSFRDRLAADGFDAAQRAIENWKYEKIPTLKGAEESLREEVKGRNDAIREYFRKKIQSGWCALSGEQWVETLRATRADVETLFEVAARFDEAFSQAKRERGELDFQDLERFCFELLLDRETSSPEQLVASDVARVEIRERYEAVLVDEYQDISPLQDAILQLSSRQGDPRQPSNLFLVGDVKQSIYRFRLAEPRLFLEKFRSFRPDAQAGAALRIDLNENHRSRAKLLLALNALCRQLMIPEIGGIAYDAAAELRGGFEFPSDVPKDAPPPTEGMPVEVHLFDRSTDVAPNADGAKEADAEEEGAAELPDELEQIEIEALWVANRIKTMVEGKEFSIWARGEKRYRPGEYRDMAVLLQTAVYKADVFVRVMRAHGVPAYTDAGSGRLLTTEMQDLHGLLEVLDNPYQDVAVAAVLRSPLVGLNEDDLARIRIHRRDEDFYSAVLAYRKSGADERLRKRLAHFLDRVERWRDLARRGPLAQAVWTIYDETGYLDYVTAMEDGAQRRANLIGLYDRARQFDEFSRRGLGRFLEFIRRLQETEGELGAPSALSEAEDVVRVMSIHKSKGLEFPVVFVPDIGKAFNFENARGDVISDRDLGVALRAVEPGRGIKYATAAHLVAARQVRREMLAEQMRLLYVALTRAREKLVLCGSVKLDQALREWLRYGSAERPARGPLDPTTVGSARCFADWIGPALARLGCLSTTGCQPVPDSAHERQPFAVQYHGADERKGLQLRRRERGADEDQLRKVAAMQPVSPPPHDRSAVAQVMKRLTWRYAWRPLTEIRGKLSVSEIKQRLDAGREADEAPRGWFVAPTARRPAFIMSRGEARAALTASEAGTAVHTVLRHLDLARAADEAEVKRQIEQMVAQGKLLPAEAEAVDSSLIVQFLNSPLGLEMRRQPNRVWRELPFSLAVGAHEIERGLSPAQSENEWIHVQGIMDCLIERPEGFALVDFKTDRIEAGEASERAERYRPQMDLYARAVETIFRRPIVERILYFLQPGMAARI